MEDFTIIYDNEDIVGKVADVKKCFINQLANDLLDKDIYIDDKINQINLVQELLEKIKDLSNNEIIKVSYNPVGTFNFKVVDWRDIDEN